MTAVPSTPCMKALYVALLIAMVAVAPGCSTSKVATPAIQPKVGSPVVAKAAVAPLPQAWPVSPADKTMRDVISSWSKLSGYTFEREHWTVPVDLPIIGSDTFYGDYRTAVRALVASSELGDTPLQACFYINNVVTVVPFNQICNRVTAR